MSYEQRIYNQARAGTSLNPGLPETLALLVVAQSKHESGNYTSNLFRSYNNAFGYSYSGSRYQSAAGTKADNGLPIAAYNNVEDSTKEIVDYIYRRRNSGQFPALDTITTPEQYAALLKQVGYYGDTQSNYTRGLKSFFSSAVVAAAGGGTLLLLGLGAYLLYKRYKK